MGIIPQASGTQAEAARYANALRSKFNTQITQYYLYSFFCY